MLKVKKQTLLGIASIVWMIAGLNVLRIGLMAYADYFTGMNIALSIVVFLVFQIFIFGKLVKKHTVRILAYEGKQFFLNFFDMKSFMIMAVMMIGGIAIRVFELAPLRFIAFFYTGLGASLFLAGILFGVEWFKALQGSTYMNISIFYLILALAGGVFYREFTKMYGFTGKTMLSVVHTHYLMLGAFFFLLLIVLEKNYHFIDSKTKQILMGYHIGLNVTVLFFIVRGIVQVLDINLSKGLNASIAGMAGIGHIILAFSLVLLFLQLKKKVD